MSKDFLDRTSFKTVDQMIKYLNDEEAKHPIKTFCTRVYYSVIRFCEDIYRDTRAFIQRGKRGYADCDVWSFDYYLAKVIVGALTKLKKDKCGFPIEISKLYGDDAEKAWDNILTLIIDGFQGVIDFHDSDDYYSPEKFKEIEKRLQNSLELMKVYYFSLWD